MKVFLETEAKLYIQQNIRNGIYDLVWSYMNDFENNDNPYDNRRDAIQLWKDIAAVQRRSSATILETGKDIMKQGVLHKDALHLSCAIHSQCDYFISTDTKLLKKQINGIRLVNPIEFIDATEAGL